MTEASARGIARLAREAGDGHPVAVARHKQPVAVVLGFAEYERLLEIAATAGARRRPSVLGPPQG